MFKNKIKYLFIALALAMGPFISEAQNLTYKANWQNLDLVSDTTFGISTEKAYQELLKNKKAVNVVVAVIDGGVDISHEDLKSVIYTNPKEKLDGKDDDKNGYIDDINGWDFLGGPKGDVEFETLELVRQIRALNPKYENKSTDSLSKTNEAEYLKYLNMKNELNQKLTEAKNNLNGIYGFKTVLENMVKKMGKENPALADFEAFEPTERGEAQVKKVMLNVMKEEPDFATFKKEQIDAAFDHFKEQVDYNYNIDYNPRDIVGDDENDPRQKIYGNNDVTGPDALHGTHVAGIIGANRDNNLGIKGVANHAIIMSVRAVPNGDERDKDVANAIRYAVDNGAKVINMSFGKGYSPHKDVVDDAVKYAVSKDVLLVHAAGNDDMNLDLESSKNYPNRIYADQTGTAAPSWIEVGASGPTDDASLKASFSNYGKTSVDVFAPGERIYSTTPNSTYTEEDGTSMASPVVAGLATLIRSYFPKLTAPEVKNAIMQSVVKVNHPVELMIGKDKKTVPFSDLCISGGVVNTYNAIKLAESMAKTSAKK
ncbi:S8 family peptidase [Pedobacter sp. SD-b]|uniref:S8 family peptidase n=1 Tax=Pedobacter segetis TaxID=2793069 RepID=A0ABS1BIU6_9SPHI|nr:S8 family peptidase [Pedobacter segetis]MBK0382784.1 S8 family peptidase [Pedobacter segetis]